ncbi:hypothetical protein LOAG_02176 [Loa loa]|uniref:Uncharacterized protein n=1 Tax=Loa loa TaxID=7209 RepID=A0A1S0U717_LOALO|nr:hypothetical protein LOAG_02176 [Loa loa]EFO26304.1 hypothetical protein LOAG_02176 [Loa loa]
MFFVLEADSAHILEGSSSVISNVFLCLPIRGHSGPLLAVYMAKAECSCVLSSPGLTLVTLPCARTVTLVTLVKKSDQWVFRIARRQRWWKRSRSRIGGGRRPMIQIFPKTLYVFADKSSILVSEDMILPRPWTVQRRM